MKAEVKKQWIEALRSGKYTQGKRCLRFDHDGKTLHDVLGVLCEVVIARQTDSPLFHWVQTPSGCNALLGESRYLPSFVADYSGLKIDPTISDESGVKRSLSIMNDSGTAFEKLAKLIERHL